MLGSMFVFFFKQKTAYEMRISDWSSDVCSSDLGLDVSDKTTHVCVVDDDGAVLKRDVVASDPIPKSDPARQLRAFVLDIPPAKKFKTYQIGRASCRERVCQYV